MVNVDRPYVYALRKVVIHSGICQKKDIIVFDFEHFFLGVIKRFQEQIVGPERTQKRQEI